MAVIRKADLSNILGGDSVHFNLYLEMQYEDWELNTNWRVILKIRESDNVSADDFVGDTKVHRNTGYVFDIASTSSHVHGYILRVKIPEDSVDTEPGWEEIYADIDVVPETIPKTPLSARGRSNTLEVRV